ncbi:hypothetical protein X971_5420 (plasmid) [Agrobacterium tumefaciens LBA4213 (Ach5)]|nr:hypothetical protein X971_5420 [Agrobacterium tumefaciens LBA4213 (Ach5)]
MATAFAALSRQTSNGTSINATSILDDWTTLPFPENIRVDP